MYLRGVIRCRVFSLNYEKPSIFLLLFGDSLNVVASQTHEHFQKNIVTLYKK